MLERPGMLDAKEKQLARRYAVFFRIPRLAANSPSSIFGDVHTSEMRKTTTEECQTQTAKPEILKSPQAEENYSKSAHQLGQADIVEYRAEMFDPKNFPALQPSMFDGSTELFDFSDFFGGYLENDFMMA